MKTLYLDLFSGISGDMFLGALLDLGVDFDRLQAELSKLGLSGYHLHRRQAQKAQITGVRFEVHLEEASDPHRHEHTHANGEQHSHTHSHAGAGSHGAKEVRSFALIRDLIQRSPLSDWVKARSVAVFARVAEAEGRVHGVPAELVHFHEVGAVDSIVDIVGACIGLEALGYPRVVASAVVEGTGWLTCAHGRYPLPGPATLSILGVRGVPISQCEEPNELVTPTGAALLAEFAENFGPMQGLVAHQIGYGLGSRDLGSRPNALRAVLGNTSLGDATAMPPLHDWDTDTVAVLETNLDDVTPEILGHFVERALGLGALDVFHTSIQMKKNRPGVLLTVLCEPSEADRFAELILCETTAFGVRRSVAERRKLRREFVDVATSWGSVRVKLGRLDGRVVQAAPEYESCRSLAEQAGVPVRQIYEAARRAVG